MSFHFGINLAPTTPHFWRIRDVEVPILAGATAAPVKYRWRRPLVIVYARIEVLSADAADLAGLELEWDDGDDQLITTGKKTAKLCGGVFTREWMRMQVEVVPSKLHTFTFSNAGSNTVTPRLFFRCVEGG